MKRNGFNVMRKLLVIVKPLAHYMVLAVVMGILGHVSAAFTTVLAGYAVLAVLGLVHFSLAHLFVAMVVFALARGFLRYAEQACNHLIAFKLLALIRDRVFTALRRLCPAKLETKEKGNLIHVITGDIELLEVFYAHTISPVCIALLFSLGMCFFIGAFHRLLGALAFLAYVTVGAMLPLLMGRWSGDLGALLRKKAGAMAAFVLDSMRGLTEILQMRAGERRLEQMERQSVSLLAEEEKLKQIAGISAAVTHAVVLTFDILMLLIAAQMVGFSAGLICTLALMSSFGPVLSLAALGTGLQNTLAAGNRVLDILEEEPLLEDIEGKEELTFTSAKAEDVYFAYDGEMVLKGLSLTCPQHGIVGIEGRSGSGKSTLLKLFMRFWKPNQGRVLISDTDVERINTADLRRMQAYVTQETHLFHDSIAANLRIAKLNAQDEELVQACKKASIHEFIMSLPQGYQTEVGELGDTLSGGERQRLGLARAFLCDAPLWLLDEPTSNLDSLNEAVILRSLARERKNKCIVLVSHRKSTMSIVDHHYLVEYGRNS